MQLLERPWGAEADKREFWTYNQPQFGGAYVPSRTFPCAGDGVPRLHGPKHPEDQVASDGRRRGMVLPRRSMAPGVREWPEAYAVLTTAAGPDLAHLKKRQMAVVLREDWMAWLDGSKPNAELLGPLPAGTFRVERVS